MKCCMKFHFFPYYDLSLIPLHRPGVPWDPHLPQKRTVVGTEHNAVDLCARQLCSGQGGRAVSECHPQGNVQREMKEANPQQHALFPPWSAGISAAPLGSCYQRQPKGLKFDPFKDWHLNFGHAQQENINEWGQCSLSATHRSAARLTDYGQCKKSFGNRSWFTVCKSLQISLWAQCQPRCPLQVDQLYFIPDPWCVIDCLGHMVLFWLLEWMSEWIQEK